jgi:lipopolysaccharide assembly protein A
MQIFLFVALSIAAIAVLFALQNSTPVEVKFLAWTFESSLAMVLLVALAAGALISYFFSLPGNLHTRFALRNQRKRTSELETGLAETKAHLEDAEARSELLEAKLTLLDVGSNPAPAQLPAPEETPPAEPPATQYPQGMATGRNKAS